MHGALSLHQLYFARPAFGYANHRTPLKGTLSFSALLLSCLLAARVTSIINGAFISFLMSE
jgi:hypothetical protein